MFFFVTFNLFLHILNYIDLLTSAHCQYTCYSKHNSKIRKLKYYENMRIIAVREIRRQASFVYGLLVDQLPRGGLSMPSIGQPQPQPQPQPTFARIPPAYNQQNTNQQQHAMYHQYNAQMQQQQYYANQQHQKQQQKAPQPKQNKSTVRSVFDPFA